MGNFIHSKCSRLLISQADMLEAISGLTVEFPRLMVWEGLQSAIPRFGLKSGLGIYDYYGSHGLTQIISVITDQIWSSCCSNGNTIWWDCVAPCSNKKIKSNIFPSCHGHITPWCPWFFFLCHPLHRDGLSFRGNCDIPETLCTVLLKPW